MWVKQPGTIQATAMAVEDGAVLATLFAHLTEERQIESFLYAFQELRQARVRTVRAGELASAFFMTADGPEAAQRDAAMRAKVREGGNVLDSEGEASAAWDEYRSGGDRRGGPSSWWYWTDTGQAQRVVGPGWRRLGCA